MADSSIEFLMGCLASAYVIGFCFGLMVKSFFKTTEYISNA